MNIFPTFHRAHTKRLHRKLKSFRFAPICVLFLLVASAMASFADSFSVTNYIAANTTITSWPTNTVGTNSVGVLTGGSISTKNSRRGLLEVSGIPGGNTVFGLTLVRSGLDSSPQVNINANNWTLQNDWGNLSSYTYSFAVTGTNAFTWNTNLDESTIGEANFVGVYQFTNGAASVSNLVIRLDKKILPLRYP